MDGFPIAGWFQLLAFGAFVGAGGQAARMIVGLKKLSDAASAASTTGNSKSMSDLIIPSQLWVSLAIGAVAGGMAAATIIPVENLLITGQQVAGLAAAGYAGADFIEGFMSRAKADPGAPAGQDVVATGGTGEPAADDGAVG